MKRKIVQINEDKCNGCGACIDICAEAALELINGKAKIVKDFYCDGMGACLDVCPVDALKIVEKEVTKYDPQKTYEHVKKARGKKEAQKVHGINKDESSPEPPSMACGCPGTMMKDFRQGRASSAKVEEKNTTNAESQLRQWPIQLHLLSPHAPYFKNADLIISADCVPFAYANFHQKFLKDKILIMLCPKLDDGQEIYKEKLTEIFKSQNIKSITIARMEVPCCSGIEYLIKDAQEKARTNISTEISIININGDKI